MILDYTEYICFPYLLHAPSFFFLQNVFWLKYVKNIWSHTKLEREDVFSNLLSSLILNQNEISDSSPKVNYSMETENHTLLHLFILYLNTSSFMPDFETSWVSYLKNIGSLSYWKNLKILTHCLIQHQNITDAYHKSLLIGKLSNARWWILVSQNSNFCWKTWFFVIGSSNYCQLFSC